jgi:Lrp/AsnC family transcriptional regulator, leucine-responsive regulatory protein
MPLDSVDAAVIDLLQANGRTTQADIARALGMAPSAVLERIRKLEARGVIQGYAALVDPRAIEQGLLAFVAVRTAGLHGDEKAGQQLAAIPEVLEVHHVAGEDCFLLKVRARDTEHLGGLLRTRISAIDCVISTRTTIVLGTVKESPRMPVPRAGREGTHGAVA